MANDSDAESWVWKQEDLARPPQVNGLRTPDSKFSFLSSQSATSSLHNKSKPSLSAAEVRFINPAIYAESCESFDMVAPAACRSRSFAEASCGDFALAERISGLCIDDVDFTGNQRADTYRCRSFTPSTVSSVTLTNSSKSVTRVERRCAIVDESTNHEVHRYDLNGQRILQFSTKSLSSATTSEGHPNVALSRKIAHEAWVQKKQQTALESKDRLRRAELRKRNEEEKLAKEKEERENREKENFLRWAERKQEEVENRRRTLERELELQRRLKDVEDTAVMAKTMHLRQWARKKEDVQKAQQKEQQEEQKRNEEERIKRLEESSVAYEKWREKSKSKPRPATQGLLPHQSATPTYVNPQPWRQIVDDAPDDTRKASAGGQPRRRGRKSNASHQ